MVKNHEVTPTVLTKDVFAEFQNKPLKLLNYVRGGLYDRTGKRRNLSVVGIHIAQLAEKVNIPLKHGNLTYRTLPETFIQPAYFTNIQEILTAARKTFPEKNLVVA